MRRNVHLSKTYESLGISDYELGQHLRVERREAYAKFLDELLSSVSITPDLIKQAQAQYEEVRQVLEGDGWLNSRVSFDLYPQGSLSHQTTIRSGTSNVFDLDIVARANPGVVASLDSLELLEQVQRVLQEKYKSEAEPKNRCVKLALTGKPFTMDVTPGLPTQITTPATISDFDPLLVGDRETSSSKPSNPRGFTSWFNARANIVPQVEELAIFEKARADAEPIPAQRVNLNDVLRRLIQLLKLHRNVYYRREANRERKEHAPISILITTLATSAYEYHATTNQFSSTLDLMLSVIDDMPAFIDFRNDEYHVDNPSMMAGDDGENFADKWNKPDVGRHRRQEFVRWHNNVKDTLKLLFEERDPAVIRNSAAEAFGSYAIAPANSLITALGLHQAIGSLDVLDQFNSTNPTSPAPAPKVTPHA